MAIHYCEFTIALWPHSPVALWILSMNDFKFLEENKLPRKCALCQGGSLMLEDISVFFPNNFSQALN